MSFLKSYIFSLLSIGLVVLSFMILHVYHYVGFGIPIHNYIDVTEIVFSLTTLLPFGLIVVSVSLPLLFSHEGAKTMLPTISVQKSSNELGVLRAMRKSNFLPIKRLYDNVSLNLAGTVILGLVLIIITNQILQVIKSRTIENSSIEFDLSFVAAILIGSLFIVFLSRLFHKKRIFNRFDFYRWITAVILLFFVFMTTRSLESARLISSGKPKYYVELNCTQTSIKSSDSLFFIGSTRNFYFFYKKNSGRSLIIPSTEVKMIDMKKLRGGL